jgi:uncharacterized protein YukE
MTKMGMDVDAVESVGRQLKQSAASIETIVGGIDKTVNGLLSTWDGPDAQRFVQQTWPTFRKSFAAAQTSVDGLGQSALNNAAEQRQASGVNGSGAGGGVGGGSTNPTTPPTDPTSVVPATPTAGGAILAGWESSVVGQHIDMDGHYGAQCVDLINNFANHVFPGVPWSKTVGATDFAKDIYANSNGAYFDKLPVGDTPMPGDIVCIGGNPGNYGAGHVAIVESVDGNGQIHVIEQNGNNSETGVAYKDVLSATDTAGIQGYLRAKSQ